ncbi:MAG: hypothetical protein WD716_02120 [Fimbriimonadaceae bacterium]
MPAPVHYLPIVTTVLSALFLAVLLRAARERRSGPHLLWWAFGVFAYGLGTGIESAITLFGNTVALNKAWYVAGALLGGYPLAQGVVYLLLKRRTANVLTFVTVPFIVAASVLVLMSPVDLAALDPVRPSGAILAWSWVRLLTPFINLYAFAFLVGGAIVSAVRYRRQSAGAVFVRGNVLIAIGGVLPGFGGAMAKAGHVEYLYVGEMVGLCLIWLGYTLIARHNAVRSAGGVKTELATAESE